jgi:hypothetical protein
LEVKKVELAVEKIWEVAAASVVEVVLTSVAVKILEEKVERS